MKKFAEILFVCLLALALLCSCGEEQPTEPTQSESEAPAFSQSEARPESTPEEPPEETPGEDYSEEEWLKTGGIADEFTYEEEIEWVHKTAADYSKEEIELFLTISGASFDENDLYSDDLLQIEFDRKCKLINHWLGLSAEELSQITPADKYGEGGYVTHCAAANTSLYVLEDIGAYSSPSYYIWYNNNSGEGKLIYVNGYGPENSTAAENMLLLNQRNKVVAFDLATGKRAESPLEFDFGYDEKGTNRYEIMTVKYDAAAEKIVAVYYDKETYDENTQFARTMLAVFEKDGKLIKTVDTGTDSLAMWGHFYNAPQHVLFPEAGKVKMELPISKHDSLPYELDYLDAAEKPDLGKLAKFWSKIEGSWYCNEEKAITFYVNNGKACIKYSRPEANDAPSIMTDCFVERYEVFNDYECSIHTKTPGGTVTEIFINTGEPYDNKMWISIDSKENFEYIFIG